MFKRIQIENLVRYSVAGVVLAGVILFGIICASLAYQGSLNNTARQMAYDLAPPQYPESILIDQQSGGGSTTSWDRRTYETTEPIAQVLNYMRSQDFPLYEGTSVEVDGTVYGGSTCDDSQQSRDIANQILGYQDEPLALSCVSVMVYELKEKSLIRVTIYWPSD